MGKQLLLPKARTAAARAANAADGTAAAAAAVYGGKQRTHLQKDGSAHYTGGAAQHSCVPGGCSLAGGAARAGDLQRHGRGLGKSGKNESHGGPETARHAAAFAQANKVRRPARRQVTPPAVRLKQPARARAAQHQRAYAADDEPRSGANGTYQQQRGLSGS